MRSAALLCAALLFCTYLTILVSGVSSQETLATVSAVNKRPRDKDVDASSSKQEKLVVLAMPRKDAAGKYTDGYVMKGHDADAYGDKRPTEYYSKRPQEPSYYKPQEPEYYKKPSDFYQKPDHQKTEEPDYYKKRPDDDDYQRLSKRDEYYQADEPPRRYHSEERHDGDYAEPEHDSACDAGHGGKHCELCPVGEMVVGGGGDMCATMSEIYKGLCYRL